MSKLEKAVEFLNALSLDKNIKYGLTHIGEVQISKWFDSRVVIFTNEDIKQELLSVTLTLMTMQREVVTLLTNWDATSKNSTELVEQPDVEKYTTTENDK